jgi:hypothetical protein
MIQCKVTKNGFLQILVTSDTAVTAPVTLQVRCSDKELETLKSVINKAHARMVQIQENYHTDMTLQEAYFHADVISEGVSCVVLYHSTGQGVIICKGICMSVALSDLVDISKKLSKLGG